jgi:hypothetical protein
MTKIHKVTIGYIAILSITIISAFAIHTIHKTQKKIFDINSDISWDI